MTTRVLAVLAAVAFAATGCTSGDQHEQPSASYTPPQPHTERPKTAPPIARPLTISSYQAKPCDLLHADQLSALGFTAEGDAWGRGSCAWHERDADLSFVGYTDMNALQDTYNVGQGVSFDVFRPTAVAGQPAVVYTTFEGAPACNVSIGIAQNQGIHITVSGSRPNTDWCASAVTAATDIVHNLGG